MTTVIVTLQPFLKANYLGLPNGIKEAVKQVKFTTSIDKSVMRL